MVTYIYTVIYMMTYIYILNISICSFNDTIQYSIFILLSSRASTVQLLELLFTGKISFRSSLSSVITFTVIQISQK